MDVDECYKQYKYTGEEREIFVSEFMCPYSSHEYLSKWRKNNNPFPVTGEIFAIHCLYWDADGMQQMSTEYRNIKEVGKYIYSIRTIPQNCFNTIGYRSVDLLITVVE